MTPYDELCAYTLSLHDAEFLHQLVVDAHTAQTATEASKPIALVFALLGLYLSVEKSISGRQIQRFHMQLANLGVRWTLPELPGDRGNLTAADVLAAAPGEARHRAIHAWCASVWQTYTPARSQIVELAAHHLGIA
jgi:hypothetical protein